MRFFKTTLDDPTATDPVDPLTDQSPIEIQIYERNYTRDQPQINCNYKNRHVAMRYFYEGQEYYISFYKGDRNGEPGKFHSRKNDYDHYLATMLEGDVCSPDTPTAEVEVHSDQTPTDRPRHRATHYRFEMADLSNILNMHNALREILSPSRTNNLLSGTQTNLRDLFKRIEDPSNTNTPYYWIPKVIDPEAGHPDRRLRFWLFSTICCRTSYNCTSLVLNLLDKAGIETDMSVCFSVLFPFVQVLLAIFIGYDVGEIVQLIHYRNNETGCDENLTDEILGVITSVLGLFVILIPMLPLILISSHRNVSNQCNHMTNVIKRNAHNHFDKNPLTYFTKAFATGAAVVIILSSIGLAIHAYFTPLTFEHSKSEILGLIIGAVVGFVTLFIPMIIAWSADCKGGVTNPYGLKLLLDLFEGEPPAEIQVPVGGVLRVGNRVSEQQTQLLPKNSDGIERSSRSTAI